MSIQLVIAFYISFLVHTIISYLVYKESDSLNTEITLEVSFIVLTLVFVIFDKKNIYILYSFKNINWKILSFSFIFPLITGIIVYFGINGVNEFLLGENFNVYLGYIQYDNSFIWAFIFIVITPPIFEEIAFRGFLFNQIRLVASPKVTILATALIFALVHFSMLSVLWIFPFGVVLGYLRNKYKTLWLGMIIHFIHNLIILLLDFYYFNDVSLI